MSFLSNIVSKIGQSLGLGGTQTGVPLTATNLISGKSQTAFREIHPISSTIIGGTALIGAGLVTAPIIAGAVGGTTASAGVSTAIKSIGSKIVSAVVSHPIKSVGLGLAGIGVGGILSSSPKAGEKLSNLPMSIYEGGKDVGKFIEGETPASSGIFKTIGGIIGSPLGAGLIGAGLGAGGYALYDWYTKKDVAVNSMTGLPTTSGSITTMPVGMSEPISPELVTISTNKRRRRRKAKKSVAPVQVRQNVMVSVSNKAVGTRTINYLKRELVVAR